LYECNFVLLGNDPLYSLEAFTADVALLKVQYT